MKPRSRPKNSQLDLFRARFDQLLNLDHPPCVLARKIDWSRFDIAFADCYSTEDGAPGKNIRLLAGLHCLQRIEGAEAHVQRFG
jgi:IS5 family transposase